MKGDFTRLTFDPAKRYSRVLMQQGRVQLDADWNEQGAIDDYRARRESVDVIGPSGVPEGDAGGFRIEPTADGTDLAISSGRMWVDGLLCECSPAEQSARVTSTSEIVASDFTPDGRPFEPRQWVEVRPVDGGSWTTVRVAEVDAAARTLRVTPDVGFNERDAVLRRRPTARAQPDSFGSAIGRDRGRYAVYLEAFEHHVTTLDDPAIRETALGGPDTTTRARVVWQVKLARLGDVGDGECEALDRLLAERASSRTTGRLAARVAPETAADNPCLLPPTAGYRGLEHQLYRVEVHTGGAAGAGATFKWQRDNGVVVSAIETLGQEAVVSDVGPDQARSFQANDLVEAVDDRAELDGQPGQLLRVTEVDAPARVVTLDAAPTGVDADYNPKLRRWDGTGDIVAPSGPDQWVTLEAGLQVQFSAGAYATGDYWLIPARTATSLGPGLIEWPQDDTGTPLSRPAAGVPHAFAPLAVVDFDGRRFSAPARDCRRLFPPLTDFGQAASACTIVVTPGPGWERPLVQLREGADAEICFPVGDFVATEPVVLAHKGHLVIRGAGPGTRLVAKGAEAVLAFDQCASVVVEDLTAIGGAGRGTGRSGLNGALTFRACPVVTVERVVASCSSDTDREVACVAIGGEDGDTTPAPMSVRVRDCRLTVGAVQTGLLVWDATRVEIEGNEVTVAPATGSLWKRRIVRNALQTAIVRSIKELPEDEAGESRESGESAGVRPAGGRAAPAGARPTIVRSGAHSVSFLTVPALADVWPTLIERVGIGQVDSAAILADAVKGIAADIARRVTSPAFGKDVASWLRGVEKGTPAFALQGIVVGGTAADDVQVVGNSVAGVLQGIHVGVSKRGGEVVSAGRVVVSRNRVATLLPAVPVRGRHGIYVGNCLSLSIEGNRISTRRPFRDRRDVEGIRVWGHLGRMAMVQENHIDGCTIGITFHPANEPTKRRPAWRVARNLAEDVRREKLVVVPAEHEDNVVREDNLA